MSVGTVGISQTYTAQHESALSLVRSFTTFLLGGLEGMFASDRGTGLLRRAEEEGLGLASSAQPWLEECLAY